MKAFRFPLDALLGLRRRRLEESEATLAALENRRAAALDRAASLEERSFEALESIGRRSRVSGRDLRQAAAASQALVAQAADLRRAARSLDKALAEARRQLLRARCEADVLERLREKALRQWRAEADRRQEALSAELYLARLVRSGPGGRNSDNH